MDYHPGPPEEIQAAVPLNKSFGIVPVERVITEPVEDVAPTPAEEDVHADSLPHAGEEISIPILEPVVVVEPIAGLPITEIPREFRLSSPTASSPIGSTLTLSKMNIAGHLPLPESIVSLSVVFSELPLTTVTSHFRNTCPTSLARAFLHLFNIHRRRY